DSGFFSGGHEQRMLYPVRSDDRAHGAGREDDAKLSDVASRQRRHPKLRERAAAQREQVDGSGAFRQCLPPRPFSLSLHPVDGYNYGGQLGRGGVHDSELYSPRALLGPALLGPAASEREDRQENQDVSHHRAPFSRFSPSTHIYDKLRVKCTFPPMSF